METAALSLNVSLDAFLSKGKGGRGKESQVLVFLHSRNAKISPSVIFLDEFTASRVHHEHMGSMAESHNESHALHSHEFQVMVSGASDETDIAMLVYSLGTTFYDGLPERTAIRKIGEHVIPLLAAEDGYSSPILILNAIPFESVAQAAMNTDDAKKLLLSCGPDEVRGHVTVWSEGNPKPATAQVFSEEYLDEMSHALVMGHADYFCAYLSMCIANRADLDPLRSIGMKDNVLRPVHPYTPPTYPCAISMHAAATVLTSLLPTGTMFPSVETLSVCSSQRFTSAVIDAVLIAALSIMPPVFPSQPKVKPTDTRASKAVILHSRLLQKAMAAGDTEPVLRWLAVVAKAAAIIPNILPYDADLRTSASTTSPSEIVNGARTAGLVAESADCDGQARVGVEFLLSAMDVYKKGGLPSLAMDAGRALTMAYTPVIVTAGALGAEGHARSYRTQTSGMADAGERFVKGKHLASHASAYMIRSDKMFRMLNVSDRSIAKGFRATLCTPPTFDLEQLPTAFLVEGTCAQSPLTYDPRQFDVEEWEASLRGLRCVESQQEGPLPAETAYETLLNDALCQTYGQRAAQAHLGAAASLNIESVPVFEQGCASFIRVVTQIGVRPFVYKTRDGEERVVTSFSIEQERDGRKTSGVATPDIFAPRSDTTLSLTPHRTFSKNSFDVFCKSVREVDDLPKFQRAFSGDRFEGLKSLNQALVGGDSDKIRSTAIAFFATLSDIDTSDVLQAPPIRSGGHHSEKELAASAAGEIADALVLVREAIDVEGVDIIYAGNLRESIASFSIATGMMYNISEKQAQGLRNAVRACVEADEGGDTTVSMTVVVYSDSGLAELIIQLDC